MKLGRFVSKSLWRFGRCCCVYAIAPCPLWVMAHSERPFEQIPARHCREETRKRYPPDSVRSCRMRAEHGYGFTRAMGFQLSELLSPLSSNSLRRFCLFIRARSSLLQGSLGGGSVQ
ncbi:hypothetical protein SAICODRAFT_152472 [Saitoella complicata NRRL Y-17804]|uniref:uncharacterized protein n=1 Tax=Saitoella complicata (strain BCRC 22490 / CBS 7301 / JCM 7358 / NBRC 10748 / NRRL Y-17804) TaxID=698492 RepID=UPI0008679FE6|nr:uncharacterized protein SAICODRAFT_152472 [Saitoella complicata NRRL Y-17804]ODQ55836.1 hypothetical protein SAICODRAFT_152472 [Saitoella complicata NRRL Y-17804]